MQNTYNLEELKKKYYSAADGWEDMPETNAEYKKACSELARIIPDADLQEKIKDCFGLCFDKYQMQGFIRGYALSPKEYQGEPAEGKEQEQAECFNHLELDKLTNALIISTEKIDVITDEISSEFFDLNDADSANELKHLFNSNRIKMDIVRDYVVETTKTVKKLRKVADIIFDILKKSEVRADA